MAAKSDQRPMYTEVWSSWSLVEPPVAARLPFVTSKEDTTNPKDEMRFRVQQRRIERCMSIADVAQQIQCDERVLAEYERGRLILRDDVVNHLKKLLRLV